MFSFGYEQEQICAYQLRRITSLVHILYFLCNILNHSEILLGEEERFTLKMSSDKNIFFGKGIQQGQTGPNRAKQSQTGSSRAKWGQTVPNQTIIFASQVQEGKFIPQGPNKPKTGPNRNKKSQIGPIRAKQG